MYIHAYVCVKCIHVYTCICMYVYAYVCVYVCACMRSWVYAFKCVYEICAHKPARTHA